MGSLFVLLFVSGLLGAQAPTDALQGRVHNGTTNQPVPNLPVQYILLQQGMAPVATAVTDAEGQFRLEGVEVPGDTPALLRVEFQGVTYSQPVLAQQARPGSFAIQVFEASDRPDLVSVKEHYIFLHPAGDTLFVLEQVMLENRSHPPRTYARPEGTYPFTLPGTPRAGVRVSVEGPARMPINQTPVPGQGENSFAVAYPIRPGETQVRLDYSLDYRSPFDFSKPLPLPAARTHLVTPGTEVQVTGNQLVALGTDPSTGFTGYQVTPEENLIRVEVSGQAPATSAGAGGEGGEESGLLVPIPDPVSHYRWWILSLAGLVLFMGLVYHYTR